MRKSIVTLLSSLVVVAGLLSGCGQSGQNQNPAAYYPGSTPYGYSTYGSPGYGTYGYPYSGGYGGYSGYGYGYPYSGGYGGYSGYGYGYWH